MKWAVEIQAPRHLILQGAIGQFGTILYLSSQMVRAAGWKQVPQIHGTPLAAENEHSGHKLRRVAMLAKYWTAARVNVKLHYFHAEMLIASS